MYRTVLPCHSTRGCRNWVSSVGGPAQRSGHSTQRRWRRRYSEGTDKVAGTLLWSHSSWILSGKIQNDTEYRFKPPTAALLIVVPYFLTVSEIEFLFFPSAIYKCCLKPLFIIYGLTVFFPSPEASEQGKMPQLCHSMKSGILTG